MKNLYIVYALTGILFPFLCACSSAPAQKPAQTALVSDEISKGIEQVRQSSSYVLQPGDLVEI